MADFVVGGVARDEDYYFYRDYVNEVWELLKNDSLLILSPRRTGKTSLMYQMLNNPANNYQVFHLNVEDLNNAGDFYLSLLSAIHDGNPSLLKKISLGLDYVAKALGCVSEVAGFGFKVQLRKSNWHKDWKILADQLMDELVKLDQPVLFIVDELPDMLNAMDKNTSMMSEFLHHFRKIRLNPKAQKIRWLVGGSVNIKGVLTDRQLLATINDLKSESLPDITAKESKAFITDMLNSKGIAFNDEIFQKIIDLLGNPIPYFLQLLTQEIYRYQKRKKIDEINNSHIQIIFDKVLLGETGRENLRHYHARISIYYPEELQEASYALLDNLSKTTAGISPKMLFSQYQESISKTINTASLEGQKNAFENLLLRLKSDFYIELNQNNKYDFKNKLIKTWWVNNWSLYE